MIYEPSDDIHERQFVNDFVDALYEAADLGTNAVWWSVADELRSVVDEYWRVRSHDNPIYSR